MADNKLDLPGDFQAGKRYLIKGETMLDWKKQIEADRALPGAGLKETDTGLGRMFKVIFPPSEYPPFALKTAEKNGDDFDLTFEPGRVIIANPKQAANSGDGYDYFVPEIDGTPMDEEDSNGDLPKLTVADGQGVYCKVNRNEAGLIVPPVQLVADDQGEDSDHYQPEDPVDSGHESEFDLIRILYFDLDDGEIELKIWRESDIELTPFLWTGENVGGQQRVFKEHAEQAGVYRFRTIKGCWASEIAEDGDVLKVEWAGENVGGGGEGTAGTGARVLIDKAEEDPGEDICAQKAKFKSLLQGAGADEKEIRITNEDEFVRIHGNGKNAALIFKNCEGVEFARWSHKDGLSTNGADVEIVVPSCDPTTEPT
jgi:hypothetical protein